MPSWQPTLGDSAGIVHTCALGSACPLQYHMHRAHACPWGSSPSTIAHASSTVVPSWQHTHAVVHSYPCGILPSAISHLRGHAALGGISPSTKSHARSYLRGDILLPSWQLALGDVTFILHTHALVAARPRRSGGILCAHASMAARPRCLACILHTHALVATRPRQSSIRIAHSCLHGSSPSAVLHAHCTCMPSWRLAPGHLAYTLPSWCPC